MYLVGDSAVFQTALATVALSIPLTVPPAPHNALTRNSQRGRARSNPHSDRRRTCYDVDPLMSGACFPVKNSPHLRPSPEGAHHEIASVAAALRQARPSSVLPPWLPTGR